MWFYAKAGKYNAAAQLGELISHAPPERLSDVLEESGPGFGESADEAIRKWGELAGIDDSPAGRMRAVARKLASAREKARRGDDGRSGKARVTGFRHGYLTWRISGGYGAVMMPTRSGLLFELRTVSPDDHFWPSHTIQELSAKKAVISDDRSTIFVPRVPKASLMGITLGDWKGQLPATMHRRAYQISGTYLLTPYWVFIILFGSIPLRQLVLLWRGRFRRAAGKCTECGYDLRAALGQCPECSSPYKRKQNAQTGQNAR